MEKIAIGFSYHKTKILSKVIRAVENSPFSHVYIRRHSKYGEYVYQASGLAVNFMNIDLFLAENVIVEEYEFELGSGKKQKLLAFFIKYTGASYAMSVLIKLLLILLGKRLGMKLKFKGDGDKTFICSELGAFFCEEILEIDIPEDLDFATPSSIHPVIKDHGKRIV